MEVINKPIFGGARGAMFEDKCEQIEHMFHDALSAVKQVSSSILDVQAPSWYDDILQFRTVIKDIEVSVIQKTCNIQSLSTFTWPFELQESDVTFKQGSSLSPDNNRKPDGVSIRGSEPRGRGSHSVVLTQQLLEKKELETHIQEEDRRRKYYLKTGFRRSNRWNSETVNVGLIPGVVNVQ